MGKTLLVFCDGTGKDGALGLPKSSRPTRDSATLGADVSAQDISPVGCGRSKPQFLTNVLRLARSVQSADVDGNPQIVFYQSGVGSEANFQGDPVDGMTKLQALGTAAASKIRDAYVFLAQNYEAEDKICLFGASRGAYTARKLSALIDKIGLLTRQDLGKFFGIWITLVDHPERVPTIPPNTRHPDISCVGVWDTVGGIYQQIDALNIADTSLPKKVKVALHALSMQENRRKFLPTLWTIPPCGLQPDQVLKQVWFAGAHTDVGGGYERHELADIALFWMAGEIKSLTQININLDYEFLRSYSQTNPDAWGTSQPHNAYLESPSPGGCETRLQSGQITKQAAFHQSVAFSPQKLKLPRCMITMDIIKQKFGKPYTPYYLPLNEFEELCKVNWGTETVSRGELRARGDDLPGGIDDIGIIIRPQWISLVDGFIPLSAIVGGRELEEQTDRMLYVARGLYQGGIYPGKASLQSAMVFITFEGDQFSIPLSDPNAVQVLVGDPLSVSWVTIQSSPFSLEQLDGAVPVPGGNEADGTILYVAQATFENGDHCGKVKVNDIARIPLDGLEECVTDSYRVLVYA